MGHVFIKVSWQFNAFLVANLTLYLFYTVLFFLVECSLGLHFSFICLSLNLSVCLLSLYICGMLYLRYVSHFSENTQVSGGLSTDVASSTPQKRFITSPRGCVAREAEAAG